MRRNGLTPAYVPGGVCGGTARDEAVRPESPDLRGPVLDIFQRKEELVELFRIWTTVTGEKAARKYAEWKNSTT